MLNNQPKGKPMPVPFAGRIVLIHAFSFLSRVYCLPFRTGKVCATVPQSLPGRSRIPPWPARPQASSREG